MLQDWREVWLERYRAYQKPIWLYLMTAAIYHVWGVPIACSRCPVPEMTTLQTILFDLIMLESIILPIWIYLIWIKRKYENDGHLD